MEITPMADKNDVDIDYKSNVNNINKDNDQV